MDLSETKNLAVTHEPAKLDEASKLLLKAADLIDKHGLAKMVRCDDKGAHCVLGALDRAAGYDPESWRDDSEKTQAWQQAVFRLATTLPTATNGFGGILGAGWTSANWNNASNRSAAEVTSRLRAVALAGGSS